MVTAQRRARPGIHSRVLNPLPAFRFSSILDLSSEEERVLMIEILHDFRYPDPRNYGSTLYILGDAGFPSSRVSQRADFTNLSFRRIRPTGEC